MQRKKVNDRPKLLSNPVRTRVTEKVIQRLENTQPFVPLDPGNTRWPTLV